MLRFIALPLQAKDNRQECHNRELHPKAHFPGTAIGKTAHATYDWMSFLTGCHFEDIIRLTLAEKNFS